MFEALLLEMAFKVQAPVLAKARSAPRLVCSMRVLVAEPDIDRDSVKTMEHSVDPGFTKASDCEATEVRRLQDPPRR